MQLAQQPLSPRLQGGTARAAPASVAQRRSSPQLFQPQGVPPLMARKQPAAASATRGPVARDTPNWHLTAADGQLQHQPIVGLASLLNTSSTSAPSGALQGPAVQPPGPSVAGSDGSLSLLYGGSSGSPGVAAAAPPPAPVDHTPSGHAAAWQPSLLPPTSQTGSLPTSPTGVARPLHQFHHQHTFPGAGGGHRASVGADSLAGVTSGRSCAGVGQWDRAAGIMGGGPPGELVRRSSMREVHHGGGGELAAAVAGHWAHEAWEQQQPAYARNDRLLQVTRGVPHCGG